MKILMLSAEVFPFAKTGGLGDVAGSLPRALRALGHDVRVVMPRYGVVDPTHFNLQKALDPFPVPFDGTGEDAAILEGKLEPDIPVYFVENKKFFDREGIYMYPDDAERFIFFSRAALEMLKRMNWQPDVIHCHDWHTALVPNWLRTIYAPDPFFNSIATVYTIHNLAYQGIFGYRVLEIAGLASYGFIAHPNVAPEINQIFDFMARGILFADKISTSSETYACEIQTPEFGEKLDPILRDRRDDLHGILNGIDMESFNPGTDPGIAQRFDVNSLDARAANKTALQLECHLPVSADTPLMSMVCRLTDHRGVDLVRDAIDHVLETLDVQFVVMGTGDPRYHEFFTRLQKQYPDRVSVHLTFDQQLARRIHAGSDMTLMPTRREPCGTNHLIALRYGNVPIVRAVGELADTVEEFDARKDSGTGFAFRLYDRWAMFGAIARAVQTYQFPDVWRRIQQRGMVRDSSWTVSASKYEALYQTAIESKMQTVYAAHALADDIQRTAEKLATLPQRIARLGELAYNIWWGWNPAGRRAFEILDPGLWESVSRNPVRFLREINPDKLVAASQDLNYLHLYDAALAGFDAYIQSKSTWFGSTYSYLANRSIAYLSFEFGLHASLPIYSGGLGVLSGDHIKEASDLGLPFIGIGFLYPQGYFTQHINQDGWQDVIYDKFNFALVPATIAKKPDGSNVLIEVELPGRSVYATVWRIQVGRVPIFLMDTNVDANIPADRVIADHLYGGNRETRIIQEYVLGVGGVRVMRALGYQPAVWHLNEGHCAFSVLERAREFVDQGMTFEQACDAVRATTVFTTHTPVPAGNDSFTLDLVEKYFAPMWKRLGITREQFFDIGRQYLPWGATEFSMTVLALKFVGAANGVSELHGQVSRKMWNFLWPQKSENDVPIGHVTNGVHTRTWLAPDYHVLFDEYLSADWRDRIDDPGMWQAIDQIPDEKFWATHLALKERLMKVARQRGIGASDASPFRTDALTLGFARRFATYKRATLAFRDTERLQQILNNAKRPVQLFFSGKAHPQDDPGKELIRQIIQFSRTPEFSGRVTFLEDYDINVARALVQGVDVWLNNPRRPLEASGTSGQKAALNGAPNFSVLDGWWREGFIVGVNGWAIGEDKAWDDPSAQDAADAESFYTTLEKEIVPLYYARDRDGIPRDWIQRMKNSIKTLAPRFSTMRMLKEYTTKYYVPAATK